MEQGRVVFSGDIHSALVSRDSPLSHARNAAAMLEGVVVEHDQEYKLSTIQTAAGNRLLFGGESVIGKNTRLRVRANDVSLCTLKPEASSVLNIIEGVVIECIEEDGADMLLRLDCSGDDLLSRISRKSYNTLGLTEQSKVYVQIKAMSIHGGS